MIEMQFSPLLSLRAKPKNGSVEYLKLMSRSRVSRTVLDKVFRPDSEFPWSSR